MKSNFSKTRSPADVLREEFGHTEFRGYQQAVIERLLTGHHTMVVMPTGMGKSLCFQVPALMLRKGGPELVVVLSPLIALMQDQVDGLNARGIDATLINSSLDRQTRLSRMEQLATGRFRLLYVTPERFRQASFRDVIGKRKVVLLAIDEAHCVSAWGHDFRPDYSRVGEIRKLLGNPTTVAMTATATVACQRDIAAQLNLLPDEMETFHDGIERPNLSIVVESVLEDADKLRVLMEQLNDREFLGDGGAIVYFSLIKTLEQFSDQLLAAGIDHAVYHGDRSPSERRQVLSNFMQSRVDTVLATPAFGLGVDKSDVRLVMHLETPGSLEAYWQEIGRAGRDGRPSRCVWAYNQADLMTQMQFIEWANPEASFYGRLMHELTEHADRWRGVGLKELRRRLQRVSPHDHRLDTALAMLHRHGVLANERPPGCFDVLGSLPERFRDDDFLGQKKRRDQLRLLALVRLASLAPEDRMRHIRDYFLSESV